MAKFKMKQLALAMGAALGGISLAPSAYAVNLATDGLGQVLIFPYYTVRGGWNTLLNLTNTSNEVVAVKVRFHESYNSRDVFDFNVILSPWDVWSATVSEHPTGGAILTTNDNSCAVPAISSSGTPFHVAGGNPQGLLAYTGTAADGGPTSIDRLREGYVAVFVMGTSPPVGLAANAVHSQPAGVVPAGNCDRLVEAFTIRTPGGGVAAATEAAAKWAALQAAFPNYSLNPLKGAFSLVNGTNGWNATGEAVALANFFDPTLVPAGGRTTLVSLQADPGTAGAQLPFEATYHEPDFGAANTVGEVLRENGVLSQQAAPTGGVEAVTHVLLRSNVHNQWANRTDPATGWLTQSDWVVTFPTKRFYVDQALHQFSGMARQPVNLSTTDRPGLPLGLPLAPFTVPFTGTSCDLYRVSIYNREEGTTTAPVSVLPPIFSPAPPPPPVPGRTLCQEVNVVTFGGANVLAGATSSDVTTLPGVNGWMNLDLRSYDINNVVTDNGLPVVGFSLITRQGAGNLNEAFLIDHAYTRP